MISQELLIPRVQPFNHSSSRTNYRALLRILFKKRMKSFLFWTTLLISLIFEFLYLLGFVFFDIDRDHDSAHEEISTRDCENIYKNSVFAPDTNFTRGFLKYENTTVTNITDLKTNLIKETYYDFHLSTENDFVANVYGSRSYMECYLHIGNQYLTNNTKDVYISVEKKTKTSEYGSTLYFLHILPLQQ